MKEVLKVRQIKIDGTILNVPNISPREALKILHKHKPFTKARVFALDGWNWEYTVKNNRVVRA